MSQFLIPVVGLVVSLGYLSWLATWRRNVRLKRRLNRALGALRELRDPDGEEPLLAGGEAPILLADRHMRRDAA